MNIRASTLFSVKVFKAFLHKLLMNLLKINGKDNDIKIFQFKLVAFASFARRQRKTFY